MSKRLITYEELSKHTSRSDCWIALNGKVFNVTPYLAEHPGGEDILLANAGTDATSEFNAKENGEGHTEYAKSLTEKFLVGELDLNSPVVLPKRETQLLRKYTWEEIAKHDKDEDCWIVINNKVYDITPFLNEHPGGPVIILEQSGGVDATESFVENNHSQSAKEMLNKYQIGILDTNSPKPIKKKQSTSGLPVIIALIAFAALIWAYLNFS